MNELEKKRLEKKKPGTPVATVEELEEQLVAFEQSTQFPMLQGVHLAQFFTDPELVPDELKLRTLEELIEVGALEISLEEGVTAHHLEELVVILSRFFPDEGAELTPPDPIAVDSENIVPAKPRHQMVRANDVANDDHPMLNSVQAESLLGEAFERLRTSPHLDQIQFQKVAQYWNRELVNAPFIEALMFRELLELRVEQLLRKRSFGNMKVHGLLHAIDAGLRAAEAEASSKGPIGPAVHLTPIIPLAAPPRWEALDEEASLTLQAIVKHIEEERERSFAEKNFIARLLRDLTDHLSQRLFLALWFEGERKGEASADLLSEDVEQIAQAKDEAIEYLRSRFTDEYGEEKQWFESLLAGIGTDEALFVQPFAEGALSSNVRRGIVRMVLVALGGSEPVIDGKVFSGFWTTRPDGLSSLLQIIAQSESSQEQENLLHNLAPQFPVDDLQGFVRKIRKEIKSKE